MSKTPQHTFVLSRSVSSCPFASCIAFGHLLMHSYFGRICYTSTFVEYNLFINTHTCLEVQLKPKMFYMPIMMLLQIQCVQRKAATTTTTTELYFHCFQKERHAGQISELPFLFFFSLFMRNNSSLSTVPCLLMQEQI